MTKYEEIKCYKCQEIIGYKEEKSFYSPSGRFTTSSTLFTFFYCKACKQLEQVKE